MAEQRELTAEERAEAARRERAARWVRGYWGARIAAGGLPAGAPWWVREEDWTAWREAVGDGHVRIGAEDLMEYLGAPVRGDDEAGGVRMQAPLGARAQWDVPAGVSMEVTTGAGGGGGAGRSDAHGRVRVRGRVVVPAESPGDGR